MALFIDKLLHTLAAHGGDPSQHKNKKPVKHGHHHAKKGHHHKKSHHHHSSPRRRHCAEVNLDRVLADREVCCCLEFGPCDIGLAVPPCSVLTGTINVTVLECEPVFCGPHEPVILNLLLFIEEEFTVTLPDGTKLPLEFGFHRRCTRCIPPLKDECPDPGRIRCQIAKLEKIASKIRFICADGAFDCHATVAVLLDVIIAVKLVIEEQLCVVLCHKHKHEQSLPDRASNESAEEQADLAGDENSL